MPKICIILLRPVKEYTLIYCNVGRQRDISIPEQSEWKLPDGTIVPVPSRPFTVMTSKSLSSGLGIIAGNSDLLPCIISALLRPDVPIG